MSDTPAPPPVSYSPWDAIGFGWRRFYASPATLLIPMVVAWVGLVVVAVLVDVLLLQNLLGDHACTKTRGGVPVPAHCGPSTFTQLLVAGIATAVILLVFQILAAGLYRGALRMTDGQSFSLGELFEGWSKVQVGIAAILIAVATGIGTVLCYVPGLIVGLLTQFTLLFIVDRQMNAVQALKASFRLVVEHPVPAILFYLLAVAITLVGGILCGVGLLVAYPVVLVAYAYTYRSLQGQPIAR